MVRPGALRPDAQAATGILVFILLAWVCPAAAGVVGFDNVTTVGRPGILSVLTKGRVLPAGGKRWTLAGALR